MGEPRILLWDVENTPNISYSWGKYQQDIPAFKKEWWMLCYGYKWLGDPEVHIKALPDYPGYRRNKSNDKKLLIDLRDLMNTADVAIAHNGDAFDWTKARTRWAIQGIDPPQPVKTIDTLRVARRLFNFNSNKLGDLADTLGVENKKGDAGGMPTWIGCMEGEQWAWDRMIPYCSQDIPVLEDVYLRLRPFIDNHPNLALIADRPHACPVCLQENTPVHARGKRFFGVTTRYQWWCPECRHFGYTRALTKDARPELIP